MDLMMRADPLPGIESIAAVRGGGLGDLMFVMPALEAIRAAYPSAEVTLFGTRAHAALLAGRTRAVDEVAELPYWTGVHDDPAAPRLGDVLERSERRLWDLGLQLHGGGRHAQPLLEALGAQRTAGAWTADAVRPDDGIAYVYYQHEVLRWLEVAASVGAAPVSLEPRLHLADGDAEAAADLVTCAGLGEGPLAVLHIGATDPRRRWPVERFAETASDLLAAGAEVVVVGDDEDVAGAGQLVRRAQATAGGGARIASVAGQTSLAQLCGLLERADVVVANDSGPRHLAQAFGTPTVGLYWCGNLVNAGPLTRDGHRVHLSWVVRCPVCGIDVTQVGWTAPRCEHDPSFLTEIEVDPVVRDALDLMATSPRTRGR